MYSNVFLPEPPFTQQSGYAKSGAPFEHFGGGLVGGGVTYSCFFVTMKETVTN